MTDRERYEALVMVARREGRLQTEAEAHVRRRHPGLWESIQQARAALARREKERNR